MIPFWCACWIAWQTGTNSSSRCRGVSRCSSQYSVIGTPLTSSMTKNGRPSACAGVEDLGDVGVVHQGQGLPLGLEAGEHLLRVHARLDDLQRHQALDRLGLLGHPDRAHAAFADLLQQLVRADDGAGPLADGLVDGRPGRAGGGRRRTRLAACPARSSDSTSARTCGSSPQASVRYAARSAGDANSRALPKMLLTSVMEPAMPRLHFPVRHWEWATARGGVFLSFQPAARPR